MRKLGSNQKLPTAPSRPRGLFYCPTGDQNMPDQLANDGLTEEEQRKARRAEINRQNAQKSTGLIFSLAVQKSTVLRCFFVFRVTRFRVSKSHFFYVLYMPGYI